MVDYKRQGKNNRIRGAQLQRETVKFLEDLGYTVFNRDRGGAQHEMGDVKVVGLGYVGSKRKVRFAEWLKPDKKEFAVFFREDHGPLMVSIPAENLVGLLNNYVMSFERKHL